ncbi:MAG: NADPH-dependent FMN reductase [Dongiaceae bacterium]
MMIRIIGISGSLRKASFNGALLRAAAQSCPENAHIELATIHGIPLYNADDEAGSGIPPLVESLKQMIADADGLLLATPEYNNSIPGPLKNAIDWLTRPPADIPRVFAGKPVALIGVTPGGFGTVLAQDAWLAVFRTLGMKPWFGGRLLVSRAESVFDEAGAITDTALLDRLRGFIHGFAEFVNVSAK